MKKWTKERLEAEGYDIWNAEIKNVSLSMEDHACLVSYLSLDGHGPCCCYGCYVLGKGYVGAKTFKGYASGIEAIMRIMDTVGCSTYESMKGKYVRVASKGWGSTVKIIGNIIEDKWFDYESFFKDKENEEACTND